MQSPEVLIGSHETQELQLKHPYARSRLEWLTTTSQSFGRYCNIVARAVHHCSTGASSRSDIGRGASVVEDRGGVSSREFPSADRISEQIVDLGSCTDVVVL